MAKIRTISANHCPLLALQQKEAMAVGEECCNGLKLVIVAVGLSQYWEEG